MLNHPTFITNPSVKTSLKRNVVKLRHGAGYPHRAEPAARALGPAPPGSSAWPQPAGLTVRNSEEPSGAGPVQNPAAGKKRPGPLPAGPSSSCRSGCSYPTRLLFPGTGGAAVAATGAAGCARSPRLLPAERRSRRSPARGRGLWPCCAERWRRPGCAAPARGGRRRGGVAERRGGGSGCRRRGGTAGSWLTTAGAGARSRSYWPRKEWRPGNAWRGCRGGAGGKRGVRDWPRGRPRRTGWW